ncbi:MAG TPA: molybdopterin-binding protein [Xanthomonadaceae bacterium]|jgi:DMSO/TMAO reductase YedYZ molybdopterin-dependent catalytic subunit|nr:molybdopterin-binding protein [Xanthomonadaceae bacterium]
MMGNGRRLLDRRKFLTRSIAGGSALFLAGCDKLAGTSWFSSFLDQAGPFTEATQRAITPTDALAREFTEADIAPTFRPNGSIDPQDDDYLDHVDNDFKDWKLEVRGLVEHPLSLSLEDLRALPSRTQITRHDCVEGWSCIGKWKGVPLRLVLERAGIKPQARFVVFRCMDTLDDNLYYESCRIVDAFHPQTILAYDLNDKPLPIANGAPLRVRLERKLGYKQAKYLSAIELVDSYAKLGGGKGGYWEDLGYDWYGGI